MKISKSSKSGINPLSFLTVLCIGIFVIWYHRYVQLGVFPWNSYIAWEKVQYHISLTSYVQSQGPNLLFFIVSIWWLVKRGSVGRLLVVWVGVGYFMLFAVAGLLPLSNIRFLEGYQFIPLGISATQGIWIMAKGISSKIKIKEKVTSMVTIFILLIYFTIGLFVSWQEHLGYVRQNMKDRRVYTPISLVGTFKKIEEITPKASIIIAPYDVSTMIPAMTGRRVVAGHPMMTYEVGTKKQDLDLFFRFEDAEKMKDILLKYHVSYVFTDTEIPAGMMNKVGLEKIYQNEGYNIYHILY